MINREIKMTGHDQWNKIIFSYACLYFLAAYLFISNYYFMNMKHWKQGPHEYGIESGRRVEVTIFSHWTLNTDLISTQMQYMIIQLLSL